MNGKRILITRDEDVDGTLYQGMKQLGCTPVVIPFVKIREIATLIEHVSHYHWIFFTSRNSVWAFCKYNQIPPHVKIGVVGAKTKEVVESLGYKVTFIPSVFTAQSFVDEIRSFISKEDKMLFPRGNIARDVMLKLKEDGYSLTDVVVYETLMEQPNHKQLQQQLNEIDSIIFTSPSIVRSFCQLVDSFNKEMPIFCIGPTTGDEAEKQGFKNIHIPPIHTSEGLVEKMKRSFES